MRDFISQTRLIDGSYRFPAADDADGTAFCYCSGNAEGSIGKCWKFEHAHRSVPDHRSGAVDDFGIRFYRSRADIEDAPPIRDRTGRNDLFGSLRLELVAQDYIYRQAQFGRPAGQQLAGGIQASSSTSESATG